MRTSSNPVKNLKMIRPTYSRSDRMRELLDRYFFEPALTGAPGSSALWASARRVCLRLVDIRQLEGDPFGLDGDNDGYGCEWRPPPRREGGKWQ
jgi:hypothetical protein